MYVAKIDEIRAMAGPIVQRHFEKVEAERQAALEKAEAERAAKKAEEDAKKETDVKVKEIDDIGKKSGSKVVDQLITAVTTAKPEPPRK